jgi:hypothetical protein
MLQSDPAFQDLLEVYRGEVTEIFLDFQVKLKAMAHDAADILHERMLDDPDKMKDGTLLSILQTGADRTGHGPSSKSVNVNLNADLSLRLERARKRAGLVIDHE